MNRSSLSLPARANVGNIFIQDRDMEGWGCSDLCWPSRNISAVCTIMSFKLHLYMKSNQTNERISICGHHQAPPVQQ